MTANTTQRVDVERFFFDFFAGCFSAGPGGEWVRYSDYSALLQQLAELERVARANRDGFEEYERRYYLEKDRAESAESKIAEQATEIESLRADNSAVHLQILQVLNRAEAAERAREEAVELMREVLERDRVRYLNGECVCINHSRKAELEYESGTCPHQRIAAFLAANGGRDE